LHHFGKKQNLKDMNKPFLYFMVLSISHTACKTIEQAPPPELMSVVEEVRQAYAPDKRVALFDINLEQAQGQWRLAGETNLPEARQELEARLKATGIKAQQEINLLPDSSLQGKIYALVNLSACNIRSEPKHAAELATQAMLGTPLRVYKARGSWYLVQSPDGYLGWLDEGGLSLMSAPELKAWQQAEKVVYLPDMGLARAQPSPDALPVSDLLAGNILKLTGSQSGFAQVQYPDGRTAYIPQADLMAYSAWLDSRQPTAENIIESAFSFMGRPYLWGGTSGKGVDCSGFTKMAFFLNGLQLPRDASQQVHVGQAVETDTTLVNLLPGDLLFFGRKANAEQSERITHVGIYLGDGKMIHASGAVTVESLRRGEPDFSEYRLQSFVRARRMLSGIGENGVLPIAEVPLYNQTLK
jgi:gamma-D-glutamyl-L-lysine dipeptidyl-peptidase